MILTHLNRFVPQGFWGIVEHLTSIPAFRTSPCHSAASHVHTLLPMFAHTEKVIWKWAAETDMSAPHASPRSRKTRQTEGLLCVGCSLKTPPPQPQLQSLSLPNTACRYEWYPVHWSLNPSSPWNKEHNHTSEFIFHLITIQLSMQLTIAK